EVCRDVLCAVLQYGDAFEELDKYKDASVEVFGNKTQGFPHHNHLLAISLLLEDRLGKAFVTDGDITRGQVKNAVNWANEHLDRPISLPVRMDNDRLLSRLKSFVPREKLLSAFFALSFNPFDEEMGTFVRTNFDAEDVFTFWQVQADSTDPGSIGAQDFFVDYFAMSDDLSMLTQVCLKEYTPKQYAMQLATSRIFEEIKETRDPTKPTDVSSERETPEPISVVIGKMLCMGLRNPAVARYIPIDKGIAEIAQILPDAEKLIIQAMKERKPKNKSLEEGIKTLHAESDEVFEESETVDIYDSDHLVYYERGCTYSKDISSGLKKLRKSVDKRKMKARKDYDKRYRKVEIQDKVYTRMLVLVGQENRVLPKTAWDYFESRITDDKVLNTLLALHLVPSDTVPTCYYVNALLCNPELFEDVLLNG
ncbi:MAG: hypothetical protein FWD57_10780, partial [Polyangiaceae bacterium]|nr:hypothetical protein [Polyangiaceae bacterium]